MDGGDVYVYVLFYLFFLEITVSGSGLKKGDGSENFVVQPRVGPQNKLWSGKGGRGDAGVKLIFRMCNLQNMLKGYKCDYG